MYPEDKQQTRDALLRAFDDWSKASNSILEFNEVDESQPADLNIFYAKGDHNDSLPFDGKDGVVAHGFYPISGNLHFDADEMWTLGVPVGVNLYQTAVHEIGHLLGLGHSTDQNAVMNRINRPYDRNFHLTEDDVEAIRNLYGRNDKFRYAYLLHVLGRLDTKF